MDKLLKVQDDLQSRIVRAFENFKKSPKDRRSSIDYLNTRLELLEDLWTQFSRTHTLIIQDSESEALAGSSYIKNDVYDEAEEAYVTYKCLVKSILSSVKPASISEMSTTSVAEPKSTNRAEDRIKLPKISIPTFSGTYTEWVSFRDMFVSLIHTNKDIDDVQKLHYLKGHLNGEAEQLLRHIAITKDNYSISWELLEKRYNNKKYLSNCILKRLLSQRNLASESSSALKELLDTTNECLQALKNLGIDVNSWDVIIVHLMCLKLDAESRKQWELKSTECESELPTYDQFEMFLETRFRALEFIDPKLSRPSTSAHKVSNTPVKVHHVAAATAPSCAFCSEAHKISNCKEFSKLETDDRRDFVKSHSLCFNCLGPHHSVYACRQSSRCRICHRKHHSLLHSKNSTPTTESQESKETNHSVVANAVVPATASYSSSNDEPTTTNIRNHFSTSRKLVLLPTALANATSKSGQLITLRCFIDPGSEVSFIKESVVQMLGLARIHHRSPITRLGEDKSSLSSHTAVNVNITSLLDPNVKVNIHASVLNKLTLTLPEKRVDVGFWSELSSLELADENFNEPGRIDLLIGGDVFNQILMDGLIKGPQGAPMAQKTSLGWIISGPTHTSVSELHNKISVNHVHVIDNEFLNKVWELEADPVAPDPKQHYNEEEEKFEESFAATTKRDSSGTFIVKLPFREEIPQSTEGKLYLAAKRFSILEGKFEWEPQLKEWYGIKEYEEFGHMEKIPKEEQATPGAVFLPQHAVIREDKSTSKVQVVSSYPGMNGVSLNLDLSHVSSKDSPADCAYRGTTCIHEEHLWKEGPMSLNENGIIYSKNVHLQTDLEMKADKICLLTTCSFSKVLDIIGRFTSVKRLIAACCKGFVKRLQRETFNEWLTSNEVQERLTTCIKVVQGSYYEAEIKYLKRKKRKKKRQTYLVEPMFIDEAGLLRVGRRLQHACVSENMKHPIIIPEKLHFIDLLISDMHGRTLHGGPNVVLVPDFKHKTADVNSFRRWQLTQKLVQDFWRRWSSEYLMQFHHRYKWAHRTPEPAVGDVVLVREDGLPPSRLYGIIVDKRPGADNITRVVSLKCKDNIIKRAVNKLCFLPVN